MHSFFSGQYGKTHVNSCKNTLISGGLHTDWLQAQSRGASPSLSPGKLVFDQKISLCLLPAHNGGNAFRELKFSLIVISEPRLSSKDV